MGGSVRSGVKGLVVGVRWEVVRVWVGGCVRVLGSC